MFGKLLEPEAYGHLIDLDVAGFVQWKTVTLERTHSQEGAHPCALT